MRTIYNSHCSIRRIIGAVVCCCWIVQTPFRKGYSHALGQIEHSQDSKRLPCHNLKDHCHHCVFVLRQSSGGQYGKVVCCEAVSIAQSVLHACCLFFNRTESGPADPKSINTGMILYPDDDILCQSLQHWPRCFNKIFANFWHLYAKYWWRHALRIQDRPPYPSKDG